MTVSAFATEYHVAKTGSDLNQGTFPSPFLTINRAARVAQPGDTITVHSGTYREWVDPKFGGSSDAARILYRAAPAEQVVIKGSEVVTGWKKQRDGTWKVVISNSLFTGDNPFAEKVFGDWFHDWKRDHHTADVYLNEQSLFEVTSVAAVASDSLAHPKGDPFSRHKWYAEVTDQTTTVWANFGEANPNKELVEINARQSCFFPRATGINYITVRGFRMMQAATQWAPPTAEQQGLIGPNWSKGWIIENCHISHSRCVGISLGKERSTGQNKWSLQQMKHGTQVQREVVFNALKNGWNRANIGSHVVRNCVIHDCEQGGIIGHLGCAFSEVYGNHIFDINVKEQFGGFEIAGIKFHAGIDAVIRDNFIHNCVRGIWIDWQAQGTRVSRNVLWDNSYIDLHNEVNHGPLIVDNNLFLSNLAISNVSQGTLYAHNLVAGSVRLARVLDRYTPYHFAHSTRIAGLMTIQGGDDHWFQNLFVKPSETDRVKTYGAQEYGLVHYSDYPLHGDPEWCTGKNLKDYANYTYPVTIDKNVYLAGARPFAKEQAYSVDSTSTARVEIVEENEVYYLEMDVANPSSNLGTSLINTGKIPASITSELPFESRSGEPVIIDRDYFSRKRATSPTPGPFETTRPQGRLQLWPKSDMP